MKSKETLLLILGLLFMSQISAQLYSCDFESTGNQNTDYPYSWRASDASLIAAAWCCLPEPTTGGSYFFMLDKGNLISDSSRGWYDTIDVEKGTTYQFSFLVRNMKNDPRYPYIVFRVNGVRQLLNGTGTYLELYPYNPNCSDWIRVSGSWTATQSGPVQIDISSDLSSGNVAGNDFAIDNIQISEMSATGFHNVDKELNVRVFPNPVQKGKVLNIEMERAEVKDVQVRVLNLLGEVLMNGQFESMKGSTTYTMDMEELIPGVYMVLLEGEDLYHATKLIITN